MPVDPADLPDLPPADGGDPAEATVVPGRDAVAAQLDALGLHYFMDADGDISAAWDGFVVSFLFRGADPELYAAHSLHRVPPEATRGALLEFADAWNRDTLWPKAYTHTDDEGTLALAAESQMFVGVPCPAANFSAHTVAWLQGCIELHERLVEWLSHTG